MKIKLDFITNSSSADFVINKKHLTKDDIILIKNHLEIAAAIKDKDTLKYASIYDAWNIEETTWEVKGRTSMTNFNMYHYLTKIMGLDPDIIEYEHHG